MNKERTVATVASSGVLLIGIGMLILTGWWWPGIMLVLGLSWAAELFFKGKIGQAIGTFLFFLILPILISIMSYIHISWAIIAGFTLIALGTAGVGKALFLSDGRN